MKKAYLVAVPTVTNPDMFAKEYASKVADTLKPFDGKFLVRTPEKLVKEGEETTLTVVIEFPNKEKALGWYNSDEHQKICLRTTNDRPIDLDGIRLNYVELKWIEHTQYNRPDFWRFNYQSTQGDNNE